MICNNNGLLIIPISSTRFGRWFSPSSRALDYVGSLWYNVPTMLPADNLDAEELLRFQATGRQLRGCIIPQAVTHSLVLLKMCKIVSRNMLSWLELLINRYCCICLVVYIIYIPPPWYGFDAHKFAHHSSWEHKSVRIYRSEKYLTTKL